MLNERSDLASFALDSCVITGQIEETFAKPRSYRPQMIEDDELDAYGQGNEDNGNENENENVNVKYVIAPKQISIIAGYDGKKKKILLRNNEKKMLYEYTMDALRQQLIKKFKSKKLTEPFNVHTDQGQAILTDQHIASYLFGFEGELQITK